MENLTVVSEVFWPCILGIISTVSILFSSGKSNRCFNNFLALILCVIATVLNLFSNGKSNRCFNNLLALDSSYRVGGSRPLSLKVF